MAHPIGTNFQLAAETCEFSPFPLGAIQVLRNAMGWEGVCVSAFSGESLRRCMDQRYYVMSGWVGIKFPGKERYLKGPWDTCGYTADSILQS